MHEILEKKAEFARRLGMSRQAVGKHASTPGFPLTAEGLVRVEAALAWLEANVAGRGIKASASADGQPETLNDAKLQMLAVQIDLAKISLAKARREVLDRTEVSHAVAACARGFRDVALQFPIRHGPAIAAEVGCDEALMVAALSSRLRTTMSEIAETDLPFSTSGE